MKMPIAKNMAVSVLGYHGVVGTAGRGTGLGGSVVLILNGVGDFPSLFALRQYNGSTAPR
jgi:hypothetical protein